MIIVVVIVVVIVVIISVVRVVVALMVVITVPIASFLVDTELVDSWKKLVEGRRSFCFLDPLWLMPTFQLWDVG